MLSSSSKTQPCRTLLQLLAFMSAFRHGYALTQSYCSSENTGSSYSVDNDIYQSNGACHDLCVDDYAFAVVQYQDCWCSNYVPADQQDVSDCSTPCPGYPKESCGNDSDGLFGYIALNKSPSGTAGGGSSSASSTQGSSSQQSSSTSSSPSSTSSSAPASSSSEPSGSTVYSSVPVTVVSTVSQTPSVVVSYVTLSSSSSHSTTSSASPSITSSSSTVAAVVASTDSTPTGDSSSWTKTTVVSTQVLTVSGAPVTRTVTSTPMVAKPGADTQQTERKSTTSSGTIAGAVVGSVAGVALILAGVFFLWRRRRSSSVSETGSAAERRKMERNTSVLSKTGLLSSGALGAGTDVEKSSYDSPSGYNNKRQSTFHDSNGISPVSPVAASAFDDGSQRSRRNSRPLVFDQRLNPHAIMSNWEANGSRASVGTMQDQRDYSRPLGVTNPDPIDD